MRVPIAMVAVAALGLTACSSSDKSSTAKQRDLGTGINTVDRQYARNANDTWDASVAAVKAYDLKVESDAHDSMGGEIRAQRAGGEKVLVKVRSMDERNSNVSVRVEPGNRNMAEMIHEKIADKLGLKEAKAAFFGGNSCEGTYPHDLGTSMKAAEDAAKRLDMTVTNRDVQDNKAVLDARQANSNPVQFRMKKVDKGVDVTFIAGRDKNDSMKDLCGRMKAEFESALVGRNN